MNSAEFALRENNTGSFPRGIALMFRSLGTWLYDQDPLAPLSFEGPLAAIKAKLASGERVFEQLIKTHILDNRHRTTVLLTADPDEGGRGSGGGAGAARCGAPGARCGRRGRGGRADAAAQAAAGGGRSAGGAGQDPDADARGPAAHQQADPDRRGGAGGHPSVHARPCDQWRRLSRPRLRPEGAAGTAAAVPPDLHPGADADRDEQGGFRLADAAHRPHHRRHRRQPLDLDAARRRRHGGLAVPARQGDAGARGRHAVDHDGRAHRRAARQPRAHPPDGAGIEGRVRELARRHGQRHRLDAGARRVQRGRLAEREARRGEQLFLPQGPRGADRRQLAGGAGGAGGNPHPAARPQGHGRQCHRRQLCDRGAEAGTRRLRRGAAGGAGALRARAGALRRGRSPRG